MLGRPEAVRILPLQWHDRLRNRLLRGSTASAGEWQLGSRVEQLR